MSSRPKRGARCRGGSGAGGITPSQPFDPNDATQNAADNRPRPRSIGVSVRSGGTTRFYRWICILIGHVTTTVGRAIPASGAAAMKPLARAHTRWAASAKRRGDLQGMLTHTRAAAAAAPGSFDCQMQLLRSLERFSLYSEALKRAREVIRVSANGQTLDKQSVLRALVGRCVIAYLRTLMQARNSDGRTTTISFSERASFICNSAAQIHPWTQSSERCTLNYRAFSTAVNGRPVAPSRTRATSKVRVLFLCAGNPSFIEPLIVATDRAPCLQAIRVVAPEMTTSLRDKVATVVGDLLSPTPRLAAKGFDSILSKALWHALNDADVVFIEWCNELAVLLSWAIPPSRRLIIRLHSFEAFDYYPHLVNWSNVESVIFVADHIRRFLADQGVRPELFGCVPRVIPNVNALERYRLPKSQAASRTLALVGYANANKDPLKALAILQELLNYDCNWRLRLIGHPFPDTCKKPEEERYRQQFFRVLEQPALRRAVDVRPYSGTLETEMVSIGYILSTSHREGTHETVLQGMASGAVPIVRRWPIVRPWLAGKAPFSDHWLFDTVDEAVHLILAASSSDQARNALGCIAMQEADRRNQDEVLPILMHTLLGHPK